MIRLRPDFVRTVTQVHGAAGIRWLAALPQLQARVEKRWELAIGEPYPGSYHLVMRATRADGTPAALKLGVPCREFTTEIAALRHFSGRGSVRVLAADAEIGALLLEQPEPGTSLAEVADETEAVGIAATVMQELWRPAPADAGFPTVADWGRAFARLSMRHGGDTGPLPGELVAAAESLLETLLASSPPAVLMHGDLHHGNVLRATRAPWLAIDPKGVLGDPAFEPGAFLLNPGPRPAPVLDLRIATFARTLGLDAERIRGWGIVRAVMSTCWSIEDGEGGWEGAIAVARSLVGP